MFLIGQLLSTNVLLGQTITMTGPATVCSGLDFNIVVRSDTKIWVQLDISNDGGSTWVTGNTNSPTSFNGTEWVKSIPDNINASRRYRITYSLNSDFKIVNTYEPPSGLSVTLFPTPSIIPENSQPKTLNLGLNNPLQNREIKYSALRNPASVLFTVVA